MKLLPLLLPALSLGRWACASPLEKRQAEYTNYLMVYFTGEAYENGETISMAVSNDNDPGSWTVVNNGEPLLVSSVGTTGVRDPSIIRSQDGSKFYLIATDLKVNGNPDGWDDPDLTTNGSKSIVVWESSDLTTWDGPNLVKVSPEEAGMTWAPDAMWDPNQNAFMVVRSSNIQGGMKAMRAYTNDFKTFTEAEVVDSIKGMDQTFAFDESSSTYYLVHKNGPNNLIEEASAPGLGGDWTVVSQSIGQGTMPAGEGPLIFRSNTDENKWHLWIDNYTQGGGYVPFETTDISSGEWTPSSGYELPPRNRHGYVLPITDAEREAALGATSS